MNLLLKLSTPPHTKLYMSGMKDRFVIRLGYLPETIYIIRYANKNPITQMTVVPTCEYLTTSPG